ncbi:MAG: hypothetical protein R6U44_07765 [Archaeoglobaceae archaeon]
MNEELKRNYRVIDTIKKGKAERIWEAPKEGGAEGGTTLLAKVTSMKELKKLSGILLDEEWILRKLRALNLLKEGPSND